MRELILAIGLVVWGAGAQAAQTIAGVYRCWSANVGGAGGRCPIGTPPLVLNPDGTYQMSSTKGTYRVKSGKVVLSKSKLWGPGQLDDQGHIVFEYSYKRLAHTLTYLRQDDVTHLESAAVPQSTASGISIGVDLRIRFRPSDNSAGWVNTASLQKDADSPRFDALAHGDGKTYVDAYFRNVPTGYVYKLFIGTGMQPQQIGTVDLRNTKGDVKLAVNAP